MCWFNSFPKCVQLKKALEDLTELLAEKEALAQRCQELDIQVHLIHTSLSISSEKYTFICFIYNCLASVHSADMQISVSIHIHTHACLPMVQYKQELCNSLKCLGLLSEAAVAERLWPHSLGSAVATSQCSAIESGLHWALWRVTLAQVTDHLFNWTLDRFDLFCHQSCSSAVAVR